MGLEERVVREIRVVAERDEYPIDEWEKALGIQGQGLPRIRQVRPVFGHKEISEEIMR